MKFKIYIDKKGEYRWRLLARNNKKVANSGEGFKTKCKCTKSIALILTMSAYTPVFDTNGKDQIVLAKL